MRAPDTDDLSQRRNLRISDNDEYAQIVKARSPVKQVYIFLPAFGELARSVMHVIMDLTKAFDACYYSTLLHF